MTELTMPKLSDSMEEGTILSWLKADGEHVEAGEDLVEIETDKATMTHPAEASGTLSILAAEGTSLPVGAPMARLGEGAAVTAPADEPEPVAIVAAPTGNGRSPSRANHDGDDGAIKATPLARRVARVHGVALSEVVGTGPLGRVTRGDVLSQAGLAPEPSPLPATASAPSRATAVPASAEPAQPTASGGDKGDVEVVDPSRLQAVIARRMVETTTTVPAFEVQTDVAMDAAIAFRAQLKATGAPAPSFNDLVVKAAALALREHPGANAAYREGRFERYSRVNVGIAVAAENALVVPTIFDADQKSLGAIAGEARRLADSVRDGTVTPGELSGATFTVSNLGMYGMTAIRPVINAPQAAILGVGATRVTLARVGGEIVDRHLMALTLSCDHRILYGADAALLLSTIRELLETPLRLAL